VQSVGNIDNYSNPSNLSHMSWTYTILKVGARSKCLDPDLKDTSVLKEMLLPYQSEEVEAYEISTLVNSPKNNSPMCIHLVN